MGKTDIKVKIKKCVTAWRSTTRDHASWAAAEDAMT